MKKLLYLAVLLIYFFGCSKELESYSYLYPDHEDQADNQRDTSSNIANSPYNPGSPPYSVPVIKTKNDFTSKIYIDPDYNGDNSDGTIEKPYTSINRFMKGVPANTAFLIKRGSVHECIGREESDGWNAYNDMIYNNNLIGAYGKGDRPVVRGLFIARLSDGLTVRDLSIQRESYVPLQWDAVVYMEREQGRQKSKNITIAYNEIFGIENPNKTTYYPYDDYDDAPFRYPRSGVSGAADNLVVFNNHVKDLWATGLSVHFGGDNVYFIRNYIHSLSRVSMFNKNQWSAIQADYGSMQGNGIGGSIGDREEFQIIGNYIDRSDAWGKNVITWGINNGDTWKSNLKGWKMEYNTLVGPPTGSTSPVLHIGSPPKTPIKYNIIDQTGYGAHIGKPGIWGDWPSGSLSDHFGQNPSYITDNHFIKHPNGYVKDSGFDPIIAKDNTIHTGWSNWQAWRIANPDVVVGSDIDPTNFWAGYTSQE